MVNNNNVKLIDWGKLIMIILTPLVGVIIWFSETAFQTNQNKKDIEIHSQWIEDHTRDTLFLQSKISDIKKDQAVILERIITIQKTLDAR